MKQVDLSRYSGSWYKPGSIFKRILWYITNSLFFKTLIPFPSRFKVLLLIIFGAKVGRRIVIKPNINIKYPWFLEIGSNVWIGEEVWIDNMAKVTIGNNVCVSQGAYLLTNNHNYKKETFDLMMAPINIEDGVWIAAKAVICPGVILKTHSVITAGSVITEDTQPYTIYKSQSTISTKQRQID
jgi:putative colanic acid biosynthesis acetyltransferase WcaF